MTRPRTIKSLALALVAGFTMGAPLICGGCASTEYYGDSYPQTSHVDVYWDINDVQRSYKVIGRAVTSEGFGDADKMQQSMREEAMKRGAHGVIVTKLDSIVTGESESGKADDAWRSTTINRQEQIESKFIRYTD